jgi:hypothetical protein
MRTVVLVIKHILKLCLFVQTGRCLTHLEVVVGFLLDLRREAVWAARRLAARHQQPRECRELRHRLHWQSDWSTLCCTGHCTHGR